MPIDPQTLEAIRNPARGLADIGTAYAKGVETRQNRELLQMKREQLKIARDEHMMKQQLDAIKWDADKLTVADEESKIVGGWTDAVLNQWEALPPEQRTGQSWAKIQVNLRDSLPDAAKAKIPDRIQPLSEVKAGLQGATYWEKWRAEKTEESATAKKIVWNLGEGMVEDRIYKNGEVVERSKPYKDPSLAGKGEAKPATINEAKIAQAEEALNKAGLPTDENAVNSWIHSYENYFRQTGDVVRAEQLANEAIEGGVKVEQGTVWGTNKEYEPSGLNLTQDEEKELAELEKLEAAGEL